MRIHQPASAHFATELLVFSLVFCVVVSAASARRLRAETDREKVRKIKSDRRWTNLTFVVTTGQIIGSFYSRAFDLPHEVSLRTWVITYCVFLGPGLLYLRTWAEKRDGARAQRQKARGERPYYLADR